MLPPAVFFLLSGILAAQPLATPRLSSEVENTPASTIITAKTKDREIPVTFRIDWFSGDEKPQHFLNHPVKNQSLTSTHQLGGTTLTRTIFASEKEDCIFIHIIADQPGPVHFTARFISDTPAKIHDRRQLILSGKDIHAQAWIIPFESDVTDDGTIITLQGEGEALIILNLTPDPKTHPIANTFLRLGEKHDSGHTPPSPHRIWEGVTEGRK